MKIVLSVILSLQVSAFAFDTTSNVAKEKSARKVAQTQSGACNKVAGKMALAIGKSLGQNVAVENVVLLQSQKNLEIFNVKLKPRGRDRFSSPETNGYFLVELWDLGDGCGFKSISIDSAAG